MLYKLLLNYFRLKVIRFILNRIMTKKSLKEQQVLPISIMSFFLELLASYFLNPKRKHHKPYRK